MENEGYLIPANSKKSAKIFGLFYAIDLIILGIGCFISFMILAISGGGETLKQTFAVLSPAIIVTVLILPFPNYHNVRSFLGSVIRYFGNRRKYVWKGWSIYDELKKY